MAENTKLIRLTRKALMPTASAAISFSRMDVRFRPYLEWMKRHAAKNANTTHTRLNSALEYAGMPG